MERLLLSIAEFGNTIGVSESLAKKLVRENQVMSVRIGERRLVPVAEARAYVDRLIAEATTNRDP